MSLALILAFVKTTLEGIPAIGLVHIHQPVATEPGQIPATMGASGSVKFWSVSRESTSEERLTNIQTERHHSLVLRGYYEVGDSATTEPLFQTLIELVMATFRGTYRVGVEGIDAEIIGPLQTTNVGWRILGSTLLVHYCECRLEAQELVRP